MNLPKLDDRLHSAAELIPKCDTFLDVGTDHALLPVYLLKKGVCRLAIASDLRKGPLESAAKTAALYGVTDSISLRLGNGFETVAEGEVQAAAVMGMGGILISELLEVSENTARRIETLVLQPMTAVYELRQFLYKNAYTIDTEIVSEDSGKLYTTMKIHSGKAPAQSEAELYMGRHILEKSGNPYDLYKLREVSKLEKQICGMEKSKCPDTALRLESTKRLLNDIQKLL